MSIEQMYDKLSQSKADCLCKTCEEAFDQSMSAELTVYNLFSSTLT